jgi:hypothetical protein
MYGLLTSRAYERGNRPEHRSGARRAKKGPVNLFVFSLIFVPVTGAPKQSCSAFSIIWCVIDHCSIVYRICDIKHVFDVEIPTSKYHRFLDKITETHNLKQHKNYKLIRVIYLRTRVVCPDVKTTSIDNVRKILVIKIFFFSFLILTNYLKCVYCTIKYFSIV